MIPIDEFIRIRREAGYNYTLDTIIHYYNIYLKFHYYRSKGEVIMQCYTNCSIECFTSERSVIKAVKLWDIIRKNNHLNI